MKSSSTLMGLMDSRMSEILGRERYNDNRICLYGTGNYWTAFERSAYQLTLSVPFTILSIMSEDDTRDPVVMATITADQLRDLSKKHIVSSDHPEYKELLVPWIVPELYGAWHRKEVQEFVSE